MGLSCLMGHDWEKLGGPSNAGPGKIEQKWICKRCKKVKYETW